MSLAPDRSLIPHTTDTPGLLDRAIQGDASAFAALCEARRARLWRIVYSVAHGQDAEDLVQEAVYRAFRALHTYNGQAPFDAWLCRIALNVAHDHVRSAWKRRVFCFDPHQIPVGRDEPVVSPQNEVELRDLQRRVREAVARLPERQRVPIWLHFFEGFTLVDVARLERTPEATIRSRVRAGLRRLSRVLCDLLPGQSDEAAATLSGAAAAPLGSPVSGLRPRAEGWA